MNETYVPEEECAERDGGGAAQQELEQDESVKPGAVRSVPSGRRGDVAGRRTEDRLDVMLQNIERIEDSWPTHILRTVEVNFKERISGDGNITAADPHVETEEKEMTMVEMPDAIVQPRTMMVHF